MDTDMKSTTLIPVDDAALVGLTKEERDLILAQRQKKAAEEAEKIARQNLEKASKIEKMKDQIAEFKAEKQQITNAVSSFFADFNYNMPGGFILVAEDHTNNFEASNDSWRSDAKVVYATESVSYKTFKIVSKDQVVAKDHYNQIYVTVTHYKGAYRLEIHGINDHPDRNYKKAKTVVEKINEYIASIRHANALRTSIATLHDRALAAAKDIFSDAVKHEKEEHTSYYNTGRYGRHNNNTRSSTTRWITMTYSNGFKVSYTFEEILGSEAGITTIKFKFYTMNHNAIDTDAMVNFLKSAPAIASNNPQ